MTYASLYDRPFEPHYSENWRLLRRNFWRIAFGCVRFLLQHPVRGPEVLLWRILATFFGVDGYVPTPEGFRLRYNHQLYVYFVLFVQRQLYNKAMLQAFRDHPSPRVVDVGSNVGLFTQWMANYNPHCYFYSFEPCAEFRTEHLRILGERKLWNKMDPVACSDDSGTMHYNLDGRVVQCVRLDACNLPLPIFLLKIDTDGNNLAVLRGAGVVLNACRYVLIEKEGDYSAFFPAPAWRCTDLGNDLLYEQTLQ